MKKHSAIKIISLIFISILGASIFALMMYLVKTNSHWLETRDNAAILKMVSTRNDFLSFLLVLITYLGETKTIATLCIILLILPSRKKIGIPLFLITLESVLFGILFKNMVARERPSGWFLSQSVLGYQFPHGFSFPSGHAQTGTVFWLTLSILFATTKCSNKTIGDLVVANATVLCFLISFSRVYLCVHYLSDVMAGTGLAVFIIGTNVLLFTAFQKGQKYGFE